MNAIKALETGVNQAARGDSDGRIQNSKRGGLQLSCRDEQDIVRQHRNVVRLSSEDLCGIRLDLLFAAVLMIPNDRALGFLGPPL